MMSRRTLLVVMTVVMLALVAGPWAPGPAVAQSKPLEKVTVRLDWINSGYHAVWYYAKERGIFAEHGIDLEVLEGRGSATTAQTVGNDSVMFGTADTGAVMALISQGLPVKVVAGYLRQSPLALIFPKKNGWKTFQDVAGARIGFSAGGATALIFPAVMKATGLEGKVRLIYMEPAAKPTALLEGRVDAIDSFDFLQVPLFEAKGLPVSTFPYAATGVNVPGLGVITSRNMIQKNPDLVRRFVAASVKALEATQKEPERALQSLLKVSPTLDRAIALRVLELSFNLFSSESSKGKPLGWVPPSDIEKAQDILVQYGGIKNRQPSETYFTNEFVPGS